MKLPPRPRKHTSEPTGCTHHYGRCLTRRPVRRCGSGITSASSIEPARKCAHGKPQTLARAASENLDTKRGCVLCLEKARARSPQHDLPRLSYKLPCDHVGHRPFDGATLIVRDDEVGQLPRILVGFDFDQLLLLVYCYSASGQHRARTLAIRRKH